MSRRVYRQFLLPEAQAHSFMKQTELSRWIAIMWWISRKKSATSVGQNACGQHVMEQVQTAAFEMPVFDRKSRQPVINGSDGHGQRTRRPERTAWIRCRRSSAYNESEDHGQRDADA